MKKYKDPIYLKQIGARLQLAFEYEKITPALLKRELGFSPSQISNWISGEQRIGLDATLSLSHHYGIPPSYVYEGKTSELDSNFKKFLRSKPRDMWAN